MKKNEVIFLFIITIIIQIPLTALCATNVSGNQSGIWDIGGSPYFVIGDVVVPQGSSLTIEPGVHVEVQGDYSITAEGFITAFGSSSDTIRFFGQAKTTWQGLRLENEENQSTFSYCRISDTQGINSSGIHSINSPVIVQYCLLDDHRKAINISAMGEVDPSYMEISNNNITSCVQCGILITENSNALVNNCEITHCGQGTSYWPGIQLSIQTSTGECNPTIMNNHIHHNHKQGITMANLYNYGEMAPHIENNIIECNLTGIYLYNAQGYYKNNDICNNFILGDPNSGAGVMLYGPGTHGTFVNNEVAHNFCGFYCISNATANLGDLGNLNINDDGENNIHDNIDETGTTYSVYNASPLDMKAENNTWDSDNYIEIAETIVDGNDNPAYGIVDFDPINPGVWSDYDIEDTIIHFFSNNPNPFKHSSNIRFSIEKPAKISVEIFNAKGQRIKKFSSKKYNTGKHYIEWNGKNELNRDVSSGIYLYNMIVNDVVEKTGNCVLIR